ncbi:60S ribosomal protein L4-1-like [Amaranthus tricolor]|uniref:60S ribosomal protein L4-1-like n=1 Tax=Amaranthus tricolor TaxID=29722 RepID=UPI0025856913|nr:60S ribosomal protein L4-1-like [Amaranthus tricolor]XP_057517147.1 60S ribosomal protein L4-1-like [Amaranthus tricolor]
MSSTTAAARPLVTIQTLESDMATDASTTVALPDTMKAPLRPDIVTFVHSQMSNNSRQPYAVSKKAGHQTSAESWGTGRAVSRIPRVPGGGTHRAGQGAFGNMCRGGRMFAPTKIWRKWHRAINVNQKRYAVVSAIAATAIPSLVLARGHKIESVPELPLVVSDTIESVEKTSSALKVLKSIGALDDVEKAKKSIAIRAGKGKMRNRRYISRKGPLLVYATEGSKLVKAFRNIPGVEICHVDRLNLLKLAPGGHLGRFVIWSKSAFEMLDSIYGCFDKVSEMKRKYVLPRPKMLNGDLARIINSDEIQSVVKPIKKDVSRAPLKKNPLKNLNVMLKLNPYAKTARRMALLAENERVAAKENKLQKKRKVLSKEERAKIKASGRAFYQTMISDSDYTEFENFSKWLGASQ